MGGEQCTYCLRCAHYCPHQALEVGGKPMQKSFQCIFCTYKDGTPLILELQRRDIVKALVERVPYFQSCAIVSEEETVDRWKHIPLFVYILDFVRDEFIGKPGVDLGMRPVTVTLGGEGGRGGDEASRDKELFRMTFLQMPKFDKPESECSTDLDKWLYILKNASLDRIPWADQNEAFAELAQVARLDSLTPEERCAYEKSCEELREGMMPAVE
ncbi:MAG: PD-(D/E)XK nuclease family transposase [Proteobacteria bacterium]|nr:PD-(D/E)XK nuclease family transposase [Pseudomonadota bacterium]